MNVTIRIWICAAWLVVGLPLGWGLYKSFEKSLPLFTGSAAPAK